MVEAIHVRVRYDLPDDKGETRRERYHAFDDETKAQLPQPPDFELPQSGMYLWNWYFNLSGCIRRVRDGICEPIPPSEFLAWKEATDTIVYPHEYAILQAMDAAYCEECNKELADARQRSNERMRADVEAAGKSGRRGRGKAH